MSKRIFLGSIVHVLCWIVGYWFAYDIMSHSDCKQVYGFIVGWWFALYIGFVLNIDIKSFVPVFLFYIIIFIGLFFAGEASWFYHDAPERLDLIFLAIISAQAFVFASPMSINWAVRKCSTKFVLH